MTFTAIKTDRIWEATKPLAPIRRTCMPAPDYDLSTLIVVGAVSMNILCAL